MAVEMAEEERRQTIMDQQEVTWQQKGMDWDQDFWNDKEFLPAEAGTHTATTFLNYPCKKCDKIF